MSSFLTSQSQMRRGKWTAEEELYAACIMEAFKEGSLDDVEEGMSLRGYLAHKLRTNVKRISKKYEGTNYSGKRIYLQKLEIPKAAVESRQAKLKELEARFEESVKLLEDAESAKKDMARLSNTTNTSLVTSFAPTFPSAATRTFPPACVFPSNSLAASAAFLSRDVLDENIRILASQTAANSLDARMRFTGANPLSMGSFGSLSNLEAQALMGCVPSRSLTTPVRASAVHRMLIQQQEAAFAAQILARTEAVAARKGLFYGSPAARTLEPQDLVHLNSIRRGPSCLMSLPVRPTKGPSSVKDAREWSERLGPKGRGDYVTLYPRNI